MGRKPIGAQPMTPTERQQRRRAKVLLERQQRAAAEQRRLTRNADRRDQRWDRKEREFLMEQAKIEAGGEFINFRDDTPWQIADAIMQALRSTDRFAKARELVDLLADMIGRREEQEGGQLLRGVLHNHRRDAPPPPEEPDPVDQD